jgi:hypothetical protein
MYDRTLYAWYTDTLGQCKRFKEHPGTGWTEGRPGFAKPKCPVQYDFDTDDCIPARSRYRGGLAATAATGRNEAMRVCTQFHGSRPKGLVCRHLCLNDSMAPNGFVCVNPRHIKWDTQKANVGDILAKGLHMSQTHPATPATCSIGGKAAAAQTRMCKHCGHVGRLPSFWHHAKKCGLGGS